MGIYAIAIIPLLEGLKIKKGLTPLQKAILCKHFRFYKDLDPIKKRSFEKRLKYFLMNKEFIPRKMARVTEEMKVLIGACAVQITFGYQPLKLSTFRKIILYPGQYYSYFSRRKHKGEVNANGFIVLSWEDFLKGYNIPDDGYNLGLHEMAHALRLEDAITKDEFAFINEKHLSDWHKISGREMKKIRSGQTTFLRSYAGSNRDEFFAVCVEYFFEKPIEFKQKLPELYIALGKLLNQDPATKTGNTYS